MPIPRQVSVSCGKRRHRSSLVTEAISYLLRQLASGVQLSVCGENLLFSQCRTISFLCNYPSFHSQSRGSILFAEYPRHLPSQERGVAGGKHQTGSFRSNSSKVAPYTRRNAGCTHQHRLLQGVAAVFNERWRYVTVGLFQLLRNSARVQKPKKFDCILELPFADQTPHIPGIITLWNRCESITCHIQFDLREHLTQYLNCLQKHMEPFQGIILGGAEDLIASAIRHAPGSSLVKLRTHDLLDVSI